MAKRKQTFNLNIDPVKFAEACTEQTRQRIAVLEQMRPTLVAMNGQQFFDDLKATALADLKKQEDALPQLRQSVAAQNPKKKGT